MTASNINTLVSVEKPDRRQTQVGVITKSWERWQHDLDCKIQLINVLIDGQDRKYWRPVVCEDYEYFHSSLLNYFLL